MDNNDGVSVSRVWYVSYGSNMSRTRLGCYLAGGRPPGARVRYPGARDRIPPVRDTAVQLPGRLYFAGESSVWGGGVAYYDHDSPGPTPARAYLITAEQFVDIAAQEMHRAPSPDDPLHQVLADGLPSGRHVAGPGSYETLILVGDRDSVPMITFTAPHGAADVPHTLPRANYLAMLADGLREAHGWDADQSAAYFASVTSSAAA